MRSKMAMMATGFPPPMFNHATRSLNPYSAAGDGGGDVIIASMQSGLRWNVIGKVSNCLFGEVLHAVEVTYRGHYAIKVRSEQSDEFRFGCTAWFRLRCSEA